MTIETTIKDMAEIVAGLVRQGVTFRCYQCPNDHLIGRWIIELLGGY